MAAGVAVKPRHVVKTVSPPNRAKTKNVTAFVWTTATIPARAGHRALGVTISPTVHESLNLGLLGCVTHSPQNVVTPARISMNQVQRNA